MVITYLYLSGKFYLDVKVFNPLLPGVPFLHPLKTTENRRFSDIFMGYKKEAPGSNGLEDLIR